MKLKGERMGFTKRILTKSRFSSTLISCSMTWWMASISGRSNLVTSISVPITSRRNELERTWEEEIQT